MCSNESLKASIDNLKGIVKENTLEQRKTQETVATLEAGCDVWRETRCDDHHRRLEMIEKKTEQLLIEQNKAIGKAAGWVGAVALIIQIGGLAVAYSVLVHRLSGGS